MCYKMMKMRSNMKKWIASAGIFAAFSMGLIACGDNSSSAESSSRPGSNDYCKVVSTDPFLIESVENGYFSQTTVKYEDEKLVEKVVFDDAIAAQMACDSYKKDVSYGKVVCKDNTIAAIGRDIMTASEYRDVLTLFSTMCEGDAHREDISSSSAERLSSSSERKSSSSRNVNSSSSSKTVSSSSERVESSSSSETSSDEDENWYGKTTYKKEKVVAANAAELECPENTTTDDLTGYDVAYEFNDPNDLGRDYLGENNAYADNKTSPVSAECGSIIFNGDNGLLVPLTDTFKTRGFVVEVRFMPSYDDEVGNLIVSESPGGSTDGWVLRLERTGVVFYYRDADQSSNWKSVDVGQVSLDEWHEVRVKIFPKKPEYGSIFYSMNVSLDGSLVLASEYKDDTSDLAYGFGIGYDSMYQMSHNNWFFVGKIDYIRYGKITEDDL